MEDINAYYYNVGYSEGYYNVRMGKILDKNDNIRKYYIAGYADGKSFRSISYQEDDGELYNHNRLNYIREIGYSVGYENHDAVDSCLKTQEERNAFAEGLESGKSQRLIEDKAMKEYQKVRERE